MNNIESLIEHRELCRQRDEEFLALYRPTLDAMLEQGLPESKARRLAAKFTIANGRPHYHVSYTTAYRCVCHLLEAEAKKGNKSRTFRTEEEMGLAERRLRRKMWYEITQQVRELRDQGMSITTAIEHVLEHCRASRFFISPATALTKICTRARTRTLR